MESMYRAVMDSDVNPLKKLPPAQRFQVMVYLSLMWTTIFCTGAGAWLWYGELIVLHVLVAWGELAPVRSQAETPEILEFLHRGGEERPARRQSRRQTSRSGRENGRRYRST